MPNLSDIAARVAKSGVIDDTDVLEIRRAIYSGDCTISQAEAASLFAIERGRRHYARGWSELFVEALCDHVLVQQAPAGYLSEANAAWVEGQIKASKDPSTDVHVELVTRLIERAVEVPPSFSAFALRLVKDAVIYADTPDAAGRELGSGYISEADLDLLSRILWGAGSEGHLAVSREEAEALFAIADATNGAANSDEFDDFFARAVGNYLIGATGRSVPSRETALRWACEREYKIDVLGALSRVLAATPRALSSNFAAELIKPVRTLGQDVDAAIAACERAREAASAVAAVLTAEKAGWLIERIDRNGVITPAEQALARFVAREAAALDASLKGIMSKVA
jgi:hypothetical protein